MEKRDINRMPDGRADLLCFLVATAAASYALTQEWRVDHVVANCRAWLARHLVSMNWPERVQIGQLALKIAESELLKAGIAVRLSSVQALFTGGNGAQLFEHHDSENARSLQGTRRFSVVVKKQGLQA